jgi:hypothetical protein
LGRSKSPAVRRVYFTLKDVTMARATTMTLPTLWLDCAFIGLSFFFVLVLLAH